MSITKLIDIKPLTFLPQATLCREVKIAMFMKS